MRRHALTDEQWKAVESLIPRSAARIRAPMICSKSSEWRVVKSTAYDASSARAANAPLG